jgi:hypothetical protein
VHRGWWGRAVPRRRRRCGAGLARAPQGCRGTAGHERGRDGRQAWIIPSGRRPASRRRSAVGTPRTPRSRARSR